MAAEEGVSDVFFVLFVALFCRHLPDSPRIHYTPTSLPPAFKTIMQQPPGSSYQRQPDGEAARLAAPPDLLIERDGRHCRASLRFASLLLHLAFPTPCVIATSLIKRLLDSLAVGIYVSLRSAWKI